MQQNNIFNLTKPIVLVGMMGSGKTLIGRLLSKKISLPFVDIDQEVEKIEKRTIKKIFEEKNEGFFRKVEEKTLLKFLDSRPKIIATGGGTFISARIRKIILKRSISIWLKVETKSLVERIKYSKKRPLLNNVDTKEKIEELVKNRYPFYKQAEIVIDSNSTPKNIVKKICQKISIIGSDNEKILQEKFLY